MRRILAVLGLLASMSFFVTSPAEAGEIPPTVEFDRAWTVAGGAALSVAYVVTCPDPSDYANGYRHALATNYGYLEFKCAPEPRRVVMLLPGDAPAKGAPVTLRATVYTPQCMYFDSSELENGEQGCWKISRTDTVRPRPSAFRPATSVDIGSDIEVTRVERKKNGGVRLTARFSCLGAYNFNYGPASFEVHQMTRAGHTSTRGYKDSADVFCDDEAFTRTISLPPPADRPFGKRKVVVTADWVMSEEGGPWAYYTGLHRLR
jgi:hypothetical protein